LSPYIDLELDIEKDSKTFHERWALAGDRLGRDREKADQLEKTRALPEMIALQSRGRRGITNGWRLFPRRLAL